jgi:hypothetical protein
MRLIRYVTGPDDVILDSFAGSGTTAHAVLQLNKEDEGRRRFILVEMLPNVATEITAERVRRVICGVNGLESLGGGFKYCRLGRTVFDEHGNINADVPFVDLARYVYLLETGMPAPTRPRRDNPYLGAHEGRAVYLLYNGVLGDRRATGGNVLTHATLDALPPHPGGRNALRVVYGEACRLSEATLQRLNIIFRQTPYSLRGG